MDEEPNAATGVGFCGLLCLLLTGLKLTGYITLSWWWVAASFLRSRWLF